MYLGFALYFSSQWAPIGVVAGLLGTQCPKFEQMQDACVLGEGEGRRVGAGLGVAAPFSIE